MVLLVGSDAGSIIKGRPERLSSASSTTLAPSAPTTRVSKRLLAIHAGHALLVAVCAALLLTGINHWDHNVEVAVEYATETASYISFGSQLFFTVVVLLLYETCRTVAVDKAVRLSGTLSELDGRTRAWTGLPAAITNWYTHSPPQATSRLSGSFRSIYFGIPLYLGAGLVVQLSASGALTTIVLPQSVVTDVQSFAASHTGTYGLDLGSSVSVVSWADSDHPLWAAARQEMFISIVNDTMRPGIQASILHDIPSHHYSFDLARVNSSRMHVQCHQPEDAVVEMLLLPQGSSDARDSSVEHSKTGFQVYKGKTEDNDQVWLNVSLGKPPYWDDSPGLNLTGVWAQEVQGLANTGLPTMFMLQPWVYAGEGVVGHQQAILVVATGDASLLIKDSEGSTGLTTNFTIIRSQTAKRGYDDSDDDDDDTQESTSTYDTINGYVQVLGCTLDATPAYISVTQSGMLSQEDDPEHPPLHTWSPFEWQPPCTSALERQFLVAFGHDTLVEKLLQKIYYDTSLDHNNSTLQGFEAVLELLTASYIWNFWRKCNLPSTVYYDDCKALESSRSQIQSATSGNSQVTTFTVTPIALLVVVTWRSTLAFCASVVLAGLAVVLLGWRTDLAKSDGLREAGPTRMAQLMQESCLPAIAAGEGSHIPIRYQSNADRTFENLDCGDGEKGV